jgi:hypothetical protein
VMVKVKSEDRVIQLLSTLLHLQGREIGQTMCLLTMERRKGMVTK